ncbi:hypothetical protein BDV97DRAFT_350762 [Delphinella strobiligena]|nr:hypothetical protein BDV97DRAFT_350762 [Delphinella strobiligena]
MPPIPIYADAPIAPAKADGITPQTAHVPPTATNATTSNAPAHPYPAGPAPTGFVAPPQPYPTRTQQSSAATDGPPPPQPGAVPMPPSQTQSSGSTTAPPPPQPGIPAHSSPPATTMPPQMAIPPPSTNAAPTRSTHPASPPSTPSGPTTLNLGPVLGPTSQYSVHEPSRRSLEHPPGYVQNPYSQEMTSTQRASLEAQEAADRPSRNSLSGILGGSDNAFGASTEGSGSGVWGAVKGFAAAAGQRAVELEETAWRKVNGR